MDIHNRQYRIAGALKHLDKRADITEHNKALIRKLMDYLYARGLSHGRVHKYLTTLPHIAAWMGKDFELADRSDIEHIVAEVERRDWSNWTKRDYKTLLKYFYKWLRGMEEFPPEVKWVKTRTQGGRKKLPEDLLTADEVFTLIRTAWHPRDRAFIATLAESGCRVGEIGGLRIKDIQFDAYGAALVVDGKTGMRRVRVVAAAPFLSTWLNAHPHSSDREAFVWVRKGTGEFLGYRGLEKMMKLVTDRAGIKKRTNFHNFRHTRASFLANHLTPAQMNEFFGWTQASDMPAVYVHLSGRNVDSALLSVYGIKQTDGSDSEVLKPKICWSCSTWNEFTNLVCNKCHQLLDVGQAHTQRSIREEV